MGQSGSPGIDFGAEVRGEDSEWHGCQFLEGECVVGHVLDEAGV